MPSRSARQTAVAMAKRVNSQALEPMERTAKAGSFRGSTAGLLAARDGFEKLWFDGRWMVARTDPVPTVAQAAARNYEIVRDVLEAANVSFALVSQRPMRKHVVAVPDAVWEIACRALHRAGTERALYSTIRWRVNPGRTRPQEAFVGDQRFMAAAVNATRLPVYEVSRQSVATGVHAGDYSCVLQRWVASADGAISSAPAPNETANHIATDAFESVAETTDMFGTREVRFEAAISPYLDLARFPIDLVYLWVDGSSAEWQASRREHAIPEAPSATGSGDWLFRDRDELLYSLRSVEQYAPWVRHIHLVTADQVPRWLDLNSSRVTLHSHRDIFRDQGALPTFNSHSIGSQLHWIPGLSEHYLIMNDDVLFVALVEPEDFFTPSGLARVLRSRFHAPLTPRSTLSSVENARRNSAELVKQTYGVQPTQLFAHTPIPQVKSFALELEQRFPEIFASTARSKFRSANDFEINSWLHLNALELSAGTSESQLRYQYLYLSTASHRNKLGKALRSGDAQVICLNDGPDVEGIDYDAWLAKQLGLAFPVPSVVELPRSDWR